MKENKNSKDRAGFYNKYDVWVDYIVTYYCVENKIIHPNKKQKDNCKSCCLI